jgi:nucleoporin NUP82
MGNLPLLTRERVRIFLVYLICLIKPERFVSVSTPPISYIQGLEYFVNAKSARLAPEVSAPQLKYVSSLKQQLKPLSSPVDDQLLPACLVHAPVSLSFPPARQGPFLLQPAPKELGDGLASDIIYLDIEVSNDLSNSSTDVKQNTDSAFIPVIAIAYSDGKVDVCLDVEKIEAKWTKANLVVSTPCLNYVHLTSLITNP